MSEADVLRKEMSEQVAKFTNCLTGVKTNLASMKTDISWMKEELGTLKDIQKTLSEISKSIANTNERVASNCTNVSNTRALVLWLFGILGSSTVGMFGYLIFK